MDLLNDKWESIEGPGLLQDCCVDVWRVDLNRREGCVNSLFEILSPDEKQRADKYRFEKDRQQFTVCRGVLRRIIGGYLSAYPQSVQFSYNRFGKPYLTDLDQSLRFNVSHSHGVAVIAISVNREIGIDIELVDPRVDVFSIAQSAFSVGDVSFLKSLPSTLQPATFFTGWTRKEACLKAMGDGLSSSDEHHSAIPSVLKEIDVSFTTSENGTSRDWSLTSLKTADQFKAALAVEGEIDKVRYLQFGD